MDNFVNVAQALGFPTWAILVFYFGIKLSGELKALNLSMQEYILTTERRLTKLETLIEQETDILNILEAREKE